MEVEELVSVLIVPTVASVLAMAVVLPAPRHAEKDPSVVALVLDRVALKLILAAMLVWTGKGWMTALERATPGSVPAITLLRR